MHRRGTERGRVILRAAPRIHAMQYVQARRLAARFDLPQEIQLDGDGFGAVTAAGIWIHPRALKVRVPATASREERPAR